MILMFVLIFDTINFYGRILIARLYTEELGTVLGQHLFGDEKWVILDVK